MPTKKKRKTKKKTQKTKKEKQKNKVSESARGERGKGHVAAATQPGVNSPSHKGERPGAFVTICQSCKTQYVH